MKKTFTRTNLITLLLCAGLTQIACYYVAAKTAACDGAFAVPQPDTLLYCQAARRIVEGAPFSFSAGTAVSTGTTSVLYPFLLAIPAALGAGGDALILAGFLLNAVFYLVFLVSWGSVFLDWLDTARARWTALALLACAGQPVYCALAQSDIGAWMAVSGLLAWGLSLRRPAIWGPMLVLGPWIRPEGMVVALAFILVRAAHSVWAAFGERGLPEGTDTAQDKKGTDTAWEWLWGVGGIVSMAGVFIFNYVLTGECQFSSVANKGYFKLMPFSLAVYMSVSDLFAILKGLVLGLSANIPRDAFLCPLLGGLAVLAGVFTFDWRRRAVRHLPVLVLAAFGGVLTVAHSGWQDTNYDRYLVWISPLLVLFSAAGATRLADCLPRGLNRAALPAALVLFAALGGVFSVFAYNHAARCTDMARIFAAECEEVLPPGASVGGFSNSGLAYKLSSRRFAHLSGIYSPEFFTRLFRPGALSVLKNEPDTRFDYWMDEIGSYTDVFGKERVAETQVKAGPEGLFLGKVDWSPFENARTPTVEVPGKRLVDRLDVAYEADERRCAYETIDRYGRPDFQPFFRLNTAGGVKILDCGRVLAGGDAFTVNLQTNRDAVVVMRTLPRQKVTSFAFARREDDFAFANPLSLRLSVDGVLGDVVSVPCGTNGFSDVTFTIPAALITASPARVALLGDHIACGYWFYQ